MDGAPPPPPSPGSYQEEKQIGSGGDEREAAVRRPPPPPHQSMIKGMPTLPSAPSSGNNAVLPPPPPPVGSASNTSSSLLRTGGSLPPPPSVGRASARPTSKKTSGLSPLPPPPILKKPSHNTNPPSPPSLKTSQTSSSQILESAVDSQKTETKERAGPPPTIPFSTFSKSKDQNVLAFRQTHIPVLIVSTEAAQKMGWKNGLRLADIFNGLVSAAVSGNSDQIPFRSVAKSLFLSWRDLNVRFREPDELESNKVDLPGSCRLQPSDGNLESDLCLLEDQVENLLQDDQEVRKLEDVTKDAFQLTSPLSIPWMLRYRQSLDQATDDLEHDLISCPPLILYVCTTMEAVNPLETLKSLQSVHNLPFPFQDGRWDPYNCIRQEVLVLHDNVDGPPSVDELALRSSLQRAFGAGAALLRLNSVPRATAEQLAREETTDTWQGGGNLGNCLSMADRATIRNYLVTLLTASLLPALERRIADLNAIVSDRKKGVKNVLKSFWRTGKDEPAASSAEGSKQVYDEANQVEYRSDTIESQTRLLADTLFLIQDYEAAFSTYKLVRDDFKQDKAHAHYASVQEMMALCLYFLDPYVRSREVFSHVENALLGYSKAAQQEKQRQGLPAQGNNRPTRAPASTLLATRLCLVLVTTDHVCDERHLEVADLLASGSSHETALGAAVLLEQASAQYYHAGLYRKYAFHMLMAGHMFRTAQQEHHAFRCFVSAMYVYREWHELHHHLRSALAAQLFGMGRMALSLQLYTKLLGSEGRVSTKSQQKFLSHLQEICEDHEKKALVGADRMAASGTDSTERNSICRTRLDGIVQVIRYTKSAARVLEIPNMNLPHIDDDSIHVSVGVRGDSNSKTSASSVFGNPQIGSDEVWKRLMLTTVAELKVCSPDYKEADVTTKALSRIGDPFVRAVMAEVDKERKDQLVLERSKRSATYREKPPVRAVREPIAVSFVAKNPLGIPIEVNQLQIVAKMTKIQDNQICTNEDAIKITPLESFDRSRSWVFSGSSAEYSTAAFCRVSDSAVDHSSSQTWKSTDEVEPFFVVTKSDLSLQPGDDETVTVSICPLVQGDLEIVGVRFRLLDKIWVFHPFRVKGQLLQDSRENRASRKRAESVLLKSKVQRGMPSLAAEFVPASLTAGMGPALDGQISSWKLRLSNSGTAGARGLVLKTNLPWINFSRKPKSIPVEEAQKAARSYCVGPSGTLMAPPIRGEHLKVSDEIHPGESIEIPVEIQTVGAGKQDFYLLFGYDLVDDVEVAADQANRRWLRKMFEIQVYPSLSMTARVAPSRSQLGEYLLSLELTNGRSDQPDNLEVIMHKLSLVSSSYRLEPISGQFMDDGAKIGWQERATAHFRVIPYECTSESCLLSEIVFDIAGQRATSQKAATSSLLDFNCLERASRQFEDTWTLYQRDLVRAAFEGEDEQPQSISSIRRANTASKMDDEAQGSSWMREVSPTSIERLSPASSSLENIHLICSWETADSSISGNRNIQGLQLRPRKENNTCPIILCADFEDSILHDFGKGPALVPLKVRLRNQLVTESVRFEFSLDYESLDMIGPGYFQRSLSASEDVSINLIIMLPAAGVYDLQKVNLKMLGERNSTYTFDFQWIVTLSGTKKP